MTGNNEFYNSNGTSTPATKHQLKIILDPSLKNKGLVLPVNQDVKTTTTNKLQKGIYDIYLDNLITYNALVASDDSNMCFKFRLHINGKPVSHCISQSESLNSDENLVHNESNLSSPISVHKSKKFNYVGYFLGNSIDNINFSISLLDGSSHIFNKIDTGKLIAEFTFMKRKD